LKGATVTRIVALAFVSAVALAVFALLPPLQPVSSTQPSGAAFAQMLPDELMAINFGSKEERMKKSKIEGPGMRSIGASDPDWCRPCHMNHDKVRAGLVKKQQQQARPRVTQARAAAAAPAPAASSAATPAVASSAAPAAATAAPAAAPAATPAAPAAAPAAAKP